MRGIGRMHSGPPLSRLVGPGPAVGRPQDPGGGRGGAGAPTLALVHCHGPPGGRASPRSTCFVAPRPPHSGATGTPWWPLTATCTCLGARRTTRCLMSCTAMMWTSRPGRSSSPAPTVRCVLPGTVATLGPVLHSRSLRACNTSRHVCTVPRMFSQKPTLFSLKLPL